MADDDLSDSQQPKLDRERELLAAARDARIAELIDAVCGRGWDAPASTDLERALALVEADPDLAASDFIVACATGRLDTVRSGLADDPSLATLAGGPRGWTPLVYTAFSTLAREGAASADRLAEVGSLLLEHGASPGSNYTALIHGEAEPHPFPALFGAIHVAGNLPLAERLLDAGADPNDNETLYHAAERHDTDVLDLLHRHGLDHEWLSYCLLHKIDVGHVDGVRWFLDHGADPNVRHPGGHHAIHWAVMRPGPDAMAELLLEHGADPNRTTHAGQTALDLAERWYGRTGLVESLLRHGATPGRRTPVDDAIVAAARGDEAQARALLDAHPELAGRARSQERSLVADFAQCGSTPGATTLVRLGFDASGTSWMDLTAMHWAACRGNPELARELLALGVPNVERPGSESPLHTALHRRWFGSLPGERDYAGVVRILLSSGMAVPDDLAPCGDPELDALIDSARA